MAYIKQKNADVYIINAEGDLSEHAAIINYPDLFEVVEGTPPENFERLNFSSGE